MIFFNRIKFLERDTNIYFKEINFFLKNIYFLQLSFATFEQPYAALIKWHIINNAAKCINFFTYFITYRKNILVKSKIRINLNPKKFFRWIWFYQGSTKVNFFQSFGTQRKVGFFRVGFYLIVVKPCKEFTGCYL